MRNPLSTAPKWARERLVFVTQERSKATTARITKVQKAKQRLAAVHAELMAGCEHAYADAELAAYHSTDTLGAHKHTDYVISCSACGLRLHEWRHE